MIEIKVTMKTKYDCNHQFKADHIWFQCFQIRTKYDCNLGNRARVMWLGLQSYLIPFERNCNYIWSFLNPDCINIRSILIFIAIISGLYKLNSHEITPRYTDLGWSPWNWKVFKWLFSVIFITEIFSKITLLDENHQFSHVEIGLYFRFVLLLLLVVI